MFFTVLVTVGSVTKLLTIGLVAVDVMVDVLRKRISKHSTPPEIELCS
jgi:hypothetical protein